MKGISVIIPTYNRQKLLIDAINSILNQDYQGTVEIIISDDGSTDDTLAVASSFGSRITILKKPSECKSQGASGARNRGILKATQPFICFLDSDDFYLPSHLQKMVAAVDNKPDIDFALCNSLEMIEIDKENKFRRWTKEDIKERDLNNLSISTIKFANSNGFIFKKSIFNEVGLFDENIQVGEDSDMWMRINEKFKGIYSNHYGSVIRKHALNQLTDTPKHSLLENHYKVYRNAIKRYHEFNLNDSYRLRTLKLLCLKYKISQLPIFNSIYRYISDRNANKKTQTITDNSWQSLNYFISSG